LSDNPPTSADATADSTEPPPSVGPRPIRSRLKGCLVRIVRDLVLICLGFLALVYWFQARLILPGGSTQGQPEAQVRPRGDAELLQLTTKSGERVVALYGPAQMANGEPDPAAASRPTLIFFYGNAMCLNYATSLFDRFRRLGLNVVIPDYVGYGMSSGSPSERGCQATADAVYDEVVSTRGVDPHQIVAAGWSIGGAVAIDLAARRPVGGLIAFSTFTNTHDMALTLVPIPMPRWFFVHRFESLAKLPAIHCPMLLGHGRRDSLVPFAMFERLSAAAKSPTETLVIDEADHNDFFDRGGQRIDEAMADFCRRAGHNRGSLR
jgi:uncharacterized protein